MDISQIPIGTNPPHDINVLIEISLGSYPVKYEFNKESGALFVDRFLHTAMNYPCNYGFVPHTLSNDKDPIDVMVVTNSPIIPKAIINVRPIGLLIMEDQEGMDEKILAVPTDKLYPYYKDVTSWTDLPMILTGQIKHFFTHYKDLEPGKWVRMDRWEGVEEAFTLIMDGIKLASRKNYS
ncbi:inorganic pyrophosphatase family protein [Candidatus Endolissoclinum faulkneri L2]|uniref:Inorganic pyrophosphatase n=1 Tax=Candidatus Endolissoclinum faulkneri L2 TaxID=1193729 RepID=K7Z2S3_9PROT|nr:inorganic diphosphatase [Candidatus Endolissoclinum faulkneri]AFX98273.1 inorganic pyrophosphatase family protein [Candidatus Endolissoclinum faulkneri L2]